MSIHNINYKLLLLSNDFAGNEPAPIPGAVEQNVQHGEFAFPLFRSPVTPR